MKNPFTALEPILMNISAHIASRFWQKNERIAFLRLAYEILLSDSAYTNLEQSFLDQYLTFLDIRQDDVTLMKLETAIEILEQDKLKHRIIYILIAEAVFIDEDFDKMEQEFIDELTKKYGLSLQLLNNTIMKIRDRKIGIILEEWYNEIDRAYIKLS
jgi:hypothetical protein